MNIFKVEGKFNLKALVISILIPILGSGIVSFITSNSRSLYGELQRPPLSPPGWLFGVVWPILYVLMGIASYRIYMKGSKNNSLFFYGIQLLLNFLWPITFFGLKLYGISFIVLCILIIFIGITIYKFYRVDKISAYLLMPYILWCLFAAYLNFGVWYLNEM